jgi:hypothetical protein
MALVAKLVEATRAKQKLSHIGRDLDQLPASLSTTSFSRLQEASRDTAIATFTADRILPVLERKLAEQLDEATLRAGLDWELSETGRLINRLEAEMPEQQVAFKEFVRQLVEKGGRVTDPRARSCSQVDILRNQTEAALPLMEALGAAEAMSMFIQKQMPLDTAAIQSAIVSMRPLLREIGRLSVLAECLFALKEVSDADFEKWLEFLRSDAGGKYARAASAAMRDALLARAEVYTQVMLEVARRLKDRNEI